MSMPTFDLDESTILELDNKSPTNNARSRRKEEKRNKGSASPYSGGVGAVNPRQAWLSAMHQGQGFHNLPSSGYGVKETLPPSPKLKPRMTNPASHLDKEEMYDEIQGLKALISSYKKEKALRKTHIAKLEKDLGKKDKLIEDTYSQAQSTYGPPSERSFVSTAIETNSTITGLRQKCHKFECLLKEKETEIKTLKSDMRSTRLQELEIMCDTYYQEISRLTQVMDQKDQTSRTMTPRTSSPILGSQREKILETKIQKLEVDNNTLKKQMSKTRNHSFGDNTGLLSEFAKLSRSELEEQHSQRSKELTVANQLIEELKTQNAAAEENLKQLTSKQNKESESMDKISDDRTKLEQKLTAIDGEHQAQKLVIRRLNKTVRQHEDEVEKLQKQLEKEQAMFRERMTQKTKIITDLEYEIEDLKGVQVKDESVKPVSATPVVKKVPEPKRSESPKRRSSNIKQKKDTKDETAAAEKHNAKNKVDKKEDNKENSDPKKEAEKAPETEPAHRDSKRKNVKLTEDQKTKEEEEVAAKKIQKNYRNYSLARSVSVIQKILRGHSFRSKVAKEEENESAEIIQAALRGHTLKTQHIKSLNEMNEEITKKSKAENQKSSSEPGNKDRGHDLKAVEARTEKDEKPSFQNEVSDTTDEDDLIMM